MSEDKSKLDAIPHGASLDTIVEFWETHDLGDYPNEVQEVQFVVRLPRQIALAQSVYEQLVVEADLQRVAPETLVNLWVAEKLRERESRAEVRAPSAPAPATQKPAEAVAVLAEEKATYKTEE